MQVIQAKECTGFDMKMAAGAHAALVMRTVNKGFSIATSPIPSAPVTRLTVKRHILWNHQDVIWKDPGLWYSTVRAQVPCASTIITWTVSLVQIGLWSVCSNWVYEKEITIICWCQCCKLSLQNSCQFMRHGRRKKLTAEDINRALRHSDTQVYITIPFLVDS